MKKQLLALLLALVMLMSLAVSASALIAVEDETGIRYSDGRETATQKQEEQGTQKEPSAFSVAMKKALDRVKDYWKRHGIVTVIILLLVAIVVAIVISEKEQQKKKEESRPPRRQKK